MSKLSVLSTICCKNTKKASPYKMNVEIIKEIFQLIIVGIVYGLYEDFTLSVTKVYDSDSK